VRKPAVENAVGVLALQGDFARHAATLQRLGVEPREVRTAAELESLAGLVLPGGESTTILKLMEQGKLLPALGRLRERGGAFFGTCAGLILLARNVAGPRQDSLGFLDVDVARNGYGRQIDSFETDLPWRGANGAGPEGAAEPLRGVFIRAPRIVRVGKGVEVLARAEGEPVLVREGKVLAATFHPELTDDSRLHRFFLESVLGTAVPVP
jgi:5'-phosphate synthase pdxT subunit